MDNLQRVGNAIVKPCENPEFIAAKAAQYVALTTAGLQPPRNGDDQFVARDGAKRFIDATETDEINRQYRIFLAGFAFHFRASRIDIHHKSHSISQAGPTVGHHLPAPISTRERSVGKDSVNVEGSVG